MRTIGKIALAVLIAGALIVLTGAAGAYWLNLPPEQGGTTEEQTFRVEKGESYGSVAGRLDSAGLIRSSYLFLALGKVRGTLTDLKSGLYRLTSSMTSAEIHDMLVSGNQKLFKVTIPEGLTVSETAARFAEKEICGEDAFVDAARDEELLAEYGITGPSAEGFLFPDTYLFQQNYPAAKAVEHLVQRFFRTLGEIAPEYDEIEDEELYRTVIIASIVEREYRAKDEAKRIASVFYNRLEREMPLQSCATVVYTITEKRGEPHPSKLTYSDLEIESPYNTYKRRGLPPTPIASPGAVALEAAFHPADTEYLYFLLRDPNAGRHEFSRSFSEHNRAYQLYIKGK
jgi:UPF0755 protein